jgi:hypothetical protein
MRCENCGELLKESKLQLLVKTEKDEIDASKSINWICDNCGQECIKLATI